MVDVCRAIKVGEHSNIISKMILIVVGDCQGAKPSAQHRTAGCGYMLIVVLNTNAICCGSFFLSRKKSLYYSVPKLFTGFASAAFIAWKLIVASAITIATIPPAANNHQLTLMR